MGAIKKFFNQLKPAENGQLTNRLEAGLGSRIIEALPDGVIGYDDNFKINVFNPAAEKIFNLPATAAIGQTITPDSLKKKGLAILVQVIFPSLAARLDQISEADQWPQITDLEIADPPLSLRTTLIKLGSQPGQSGTFLKIVEDRTREKQILRSKSEFIGIAAHQLRTPITAINWAFESLVSLLKDKDGLKDGLAIAEEGHATAQRSLKIVNDLLDVSKIEGGRFGFQFAENDLNNFLQAVANSLKPVADYYGIKIYFEPLPAPCPVFIDQQKLGMAVSNLIDNAIRYNNKGGEVAIRAGKQDPSFAVVSIKDTGVGIPPEEMSKLFKKFYRGSNVVQLEPNGNGLGLYITKNIVEQHGGQIEVESAVGRGTTFRISLPLDKKMVPQKEFFAENY